MEKIRTQLINSGFTQDQIEEIKAGFDEGIDITAYADKEFLAIQMRQIRFGLEHMVDVWQYKNPYYSHEQMREIRLGLEEGLDVSYFCSLMYTSADMRQRRLALEAHPGLATGGETGLTSESDEPELVRVTLAEENTLAFAELCAEEIPNLRVEILKALHGKGITYGIRYDAIDRMAEGTDSRGRVLVASGFMPKDGEDGYYEYFFRTNVARTPKMLEGGNVDYRSVDWYEEVKKGQKLAHYHGATEGKNGMAVTGREIPARKGRELCILTGKGFHRIEDGKTYVADLDGIVTLSENYAGTDTLMEIQMNVTDLLTVEAVTLAAGDVNGYFFEAVEITAGGNIHGDYFLNCELQAAGRIDVMGKKGSLAGGRASAEQGLRANILGNQAGLATYIRLGTSERLRRQELNLNKAIRDVSAELEALNHAYEEFMRKYQPQVRNSMELFLKVESAIYTKEREMDEWMKKKDRLEDEKRKAAAVSAVVENKLYEGVTFEIEQVRWTPSKRLGSVRVKKSENKIVLFSNR